MKIFIALLFSNYVLLITQSAFSQNPLVKMWDKRFGGDEYDRLTSIQQTTDGGFILAGSSNSSVSGDKTQDTWGDYDYWIVKTDSMGNKLWDKDFGGDNDDRPYSIQQTNDGGYILLGLSWSGISGDKTQPSQGSIDYWLVKTDSLGNKLWDKTFGGLSVDWPTSVKQTTDGGFILAGESNSSASGDKTQNTWGDHDYWIIKTDSSGNKLWDKDFGGINTDALTSIQQTSDGGYLLAGNSYSGIGGNKTQPSWGGCDFWIIKVDSLGIKQWDKDIGGTGEESVVSVLQTSDNGFILGGTSSSQVSGDKTQPTWGGLNDEDYWIVKTDSLCNIEWDKDFGGVNDESPGNDFEIITKAKDGGYLLGGSSYSPISGNKTENNLGPEQTWVLKTDSLGNLIWDKTVFTSGLDHSGIAIEISDGCYLIANSTNSGIAGYKTEDSWNNSLDYWIVKFCSLPVISFTATNNICPGTCIDYINTSTHAISYQWNFSGANPDTSTAIHPSNICYTNPGSYDVQLIATNANGSDTLLLTNYITVYPQPPAQSIIQINDTLFAIEGSSSYQWYFNGNIIPGATDYIYAATLNGDYNVVATDTNGCEVEAVINNVLAGLTPTLTDGEGVTVFPNPVAETIQIRGLKSNSIEELSIFNVVGEKIFSAFNCKLPIANCQLSPSLYYLEIISGEKIYRTKFLKQ